MTADWPPLGRDLNSFGGDWGAFDAHCYSCYWADFYTTRPTWPEADKSFNIKRHPEIDSRCATFAHITSEGRVESERTVALDRAERIGWPRLILDEFALTFPAAESERIVWWKSRRGNDWRYLIALADFSYVVVVADRGAYVLLWTAYPVEYDSRRRKLKAEWETYWGQS